MTIEQRKRDARSLLVKAPEMFRAGEQRDDERELSDFGRVKKLRQMRKRLRTSNNGVANVTKSGTKTSTRVLLHPLNTNIVPSPECRLSTASSRASR